MTVGNESGSFAAAGTANQDTSASGTKEQVKEQAKQAAGTAAEESAHVAGVAAGEAHRVAAEAKSQVQMLFGEATSQVEDQSRTQRDRLVDTLRTFAEDLEQMAGAAQGDTQSGTQGGMAVNLVQEVADRARSLTSSLDGREPRELLEDVRRFARRKPGTFLVGALAAGVVAGRLTRGAKAAQSSSLTGSSGGDYPAPVAPALNAPAVTGAPTGVAPGTAGTTHRAPAPQGVAAPVDPLATDPFAADPLNTRRP